MLESVGHVLAQAEPRWWIGRACKNWRKRMGIEPTMPLLAQSIIGFEVN